MNIVSLSTIPPRFHSVGATLTSLLRQSVKIDRIALHIPRTYRRFPDYDGSPPPVPDGVEIVRVAEDLGPASKVLPAAEAMRGTRCAILFCDDDRVMSRNWAESLFEAHRARPQDCIALAGKFLPEEFGAVDDEPPAALFRSQALDWTYRRRKLAWQAARLLGRRDIPRPGPRTVGRAGYVPILQGLGGVVVSPDFFDDDDRRIPGLLWTVDDIWLSGALRRKGIRIWSPADLERPVPSQDGERDSLFDAVFEGAGREELNLRCLEYMRREFGIWPRKGETPARVPADAQAALELR